MLKTLALLLDYIEDHVSEPFTLSDIEAVTHFPEYHLRVMFLHIAGISLHDYVRLRRLSRASEDLLMGASITEVAFKYCYESVDGFSRAFKAWSGYLPSEIKKQKIHTFTQKLTFSITKEGGNTMQYRIVDYPAFRFAGVQKQISLQYEGINQEIVALAHTITEAMQEEMHRLMNAAVKHVLNISWDVKHETEGSMLNHMIGVMTTEKTDLLSSIEVPALRWAVFTCEGQFPEVYQKTFSDIYAKWLPASDYILVDAPTFSYSVDTAGGKHIKRSEIFIAVQSRSV